MEMSSKDNPPIIIAGGGPVGLFLALCLIRNGFSCHVLEKQIRRAPYSRSIGIHPVSLELFDRMGITRPFLAEGVKIRRGYACLGDNKHGGMISFDRCPPPHNYILTLPQSRTEALLERELQQADSSCLLRGKAFHHVRSHANHVEVEYMYKGGNGKIRGSLLIGCDGKNSRVRQLSGISFRGYPYPDTYVMGDFVDQTSLGPDAYVWLHREGLVESFPLPGNKRRWVVKTRSYLQSPSSWEIERRVFDRLKMDLSRSKNSMTSSFGVQNYLCSTCFRGNILLAGDSAQIVSPIGGQGMNLGWISAMDLADTLAEIRDRPQDGTPLLSAWSRRSRKRALQAARRAEINMWLGRSRSLPLLRNLAIRAATKAPFQQVLARLFTMRGLGSWPL